MVGFVAARKGKTLSVLRDSKVDKGEIYDNSVAKSPNDIRIFAFSFYRAVRLENSLN